MNERKLAWRAAVSAAAITASAMLPMAANALCTVTITDAKQRWPWNNKLDIKYTISDGQLTDRGYEVIFKLVANGVTNMVSNVDLGAAAVNGDNTLVWELPDGISCENAELTASLYTASVATGGDDYLIVDLVDDDNGLTKGKITYEGLWGDQAGSNARYNRDIYKTKRLVLRKISAKNVTWWMGTTDKAVESRAGTEEAAHEVTLANDYYIGVFELTQEQWKNVYGSYRNAGNWIFLKDREMRPVACISYNQIYRNNSSTGDGSGLWPSAPNVNSIIGKLRTLSKTVDPTGLAFHLPTEAQWEYAARAGHGSGYWGDGKLIKGQLTADSNLNSYGRYKRNGGQNPVDTAASANSGEGFTEWGADYGPAIVGTYHPNDFGLYDMAGNVWEHCLDWYQADISSYNGVVNINPENYAQTLSGGTGSNGGRVLRGGSFNMEAFYARPAYRKGVGATDDWQNQYDRGIRVCVTIE